ncbi:MAG TPA: hypothetical protein VFK41_00090 [Nocardioidaceae bacterium]|nr:hypothetical protein [Nocardioidaceae bacterium]
MSVQTDTRPSPTKPLSTSTAGVVLAAPLLLLAAELTSPREPADLSDAGYVGFLVGNADRLTAAWAIGIAASAALATAYVVVVGRLRGRGSVVGRIAGVLGILGGASLAAHQGASLAALDVAMKDSSLVGAVAAIGDGRSAMVPMPFVIIGLNLAIILLAVATTRAGWTPWWVIVAAVLAFLGDWSPTNYNTVIHAAFATVVYGMIAARLRSGQPAA